MVNKLGRVRNSVCKDPDTTKNNTIEKHTDAHPSETTVSTSTFTQQRKKITKQQQCQTHLSVLKLKCRKTWAPCLEPSLVPVATLFLFRQSLGLQPELHPTRSDGVFVDLQPLPPNTTGGLSDPWRL